MMTPGSEGVVSTPSLNPYVGPRPFRADERRYFFGREQETAILEGLVMSRRATLFFAQSGVGKSSLLNAGLIPALQRQEEVGRGRRARLVQKMQVLPLVQVGGLVGADLQAQNANAFVINTLSKLLPHLKVNDYATWTVREGIARYVDTSTAIDSSANKPPVAETIEPTPQEPQTPSPTTLPAFSLVESERANATLLIFDQFEELFTYYPEAWRWREAFFQQIVEALDQYPHLHVLFSMREDYIAELTPFAHLLPDQLVHRFRMERLKRTVALLAVRAPAEAAGRAFAPNVAETLVENLARLQVARHAHVVPPKNSASLSGTELSGTMQAISAILSPQDENDPQIGEYVEPVHLQIVCQELWANLPPDRTIIEQHDVQKFGDVDQALSNFYVNALDKVCKETSQSERKLRDWFSQKLITPARTRSLLYCDESTNECEGMPLPVVNALRNAYLVRTTLRTGEDWIELAHDRLIEPILKANQSWLVTFNHPFTVALNHWVAGGKKDSDLLAGSTLSQAKQFARTYGADFYDDEKEYVERSHTQQINRLRWRLGLVVGLGVLAVLVGWGIYSTLKSQQQKEMIEQSITRNEANRLASIATQELVNARYDLALLLATEAVSKSATVESLDALRNVLAEPGRPLHILQGHQGSVDMVAWSPDGSRLATASGDKTARVWGAADGTLLTTLEGNDIQLGHTDSIVEIAWNRAGTQVATSSVDGSARIWDATSGKLLFSLSSERYVNHTEWSHDDAHIATSSHDGSIRIWDAATGLMVTQPISIHVGGVASIEWSQDDQKLLSAGYEGVAYILSRSTGEIIQTFQDPGGIYGGARWNHDESLVLTSSSDGAIRTWVSQTGALLQTLRGSSGLVWTSIWETGGNAILAAATEGVVRIWDATNALPQLVLRGHQVNSLVYEGWWSQDNRLIVTAGADGIARVWDSTTGADVAVLTHIVDKDKTIPEVRSARWSPVDDRIATAGTDGTARVWSLTPAYELPAFLAPTSVVYEFQFSSDQSQLVTASGDSAWIWQVSTGKLLHRLQHVGLVTHGRWNQDGSKIITSGLDPIARIWDAESGTELAKIEELGGEVRYAFWIANDTRIYSGHTNEMSKTYSVKVWDSRNLRQPLFELPHQAAINTVRWSDHGERIATASDDGTVRVWNAETGEELSISPFLPVTTTSPTHPVKIVDAFWIHEDRHLLIKSNDNAVHILDAQSGSLVISMTHDAEVKVANLNRDESELVTADQNGVIKLWDAESGVLKQTLTGHFAPVTVVNWSPNQDRLLSAGEDAGVRIWDAQSGKQLLLLSGHGAKINSAVWNQDGTKIVTASDDGTARIWNAVNGEVIAILRGHKAGVRAASWRAEDRQILTQGNDGSIRQYFTDPADLVRFACSIAVRNFTEDEWKGYVGEGERRATCPNLPLK